MLPSVYNKRNNEISDNPNANKRLFSAPLSSRPKSLMENGDYSKPAERIILRNEIFAWTEEGTDINTLFRHTETVCFLKYFEYNYFLDETVSLTNVIIQLKEIYLYYSTIVNFNHDTSFYKRN